jgi:acetyl-CoA C-acetyltransferase
MGTFAEDCAEAYQFTRKEQDAYAVSSLERANRAIKNGNFAWEIAPVSVKAGKTETLVTTDEQPPKGRPEKIPTLKPAFRDGGTVTAANSSSISDGAAALVMMRESEAEKRGAVPLARVVAHASHAAAPKDFPTAPIGALKTLFEKTGWSPDSVDLFEINEAFAVVAMAAMRDLGLPHDKVNVNGGACALGHPIGASGARILVTLIAALRAQGFKRGVASLCIGGGEATAMGVELI